MTTFTKRAATDTDPTTPTDSTPRILTPAEIYAHDSAARRETVPFIEFTRAFWHRLTSAGVKDEHLKGLLSETLFILPNSCGRKATIEQLSSNMSSVRQLISICEQFNSSERIKAANDPNYRLRICPIPSANTLQWLANMSA
jgi:hypothetical protein